jgi:hypothetical protein
VTRGRINHESIRVQVRAVEPGDWPAFGNAVTSARTGNPAGRVVLTETLGVKGRPDELTETDIDLAVDLIQTSFGKVGWHRHSPLSFLAPPEGALPASRPDSPDCVAAPRDPFYFAAIASSPAAFNFALSAARSGPLKVFHRAITRAAACCAVVMAAS